MLRVYYDPIFLKHIPGGWHPESPSRLEAVMRACHAVEGLEIIESCRAATRDEIELVHDSNYYDYIVSVTGKEMMLDPDTEISADSIDAAHKAAGATIMAVEFATRDDNHRAFCAVRPPGHHAEKDKARGFCIFNNIAIGAAYALQNKLVNKIAIIDFDVHHGNGTQNTFYNASNILYISLHQYPFYPGSGTAGETGAGEGEGYTINIPMRYGVGDDDYRKAFADIVIPEIDKFAPELMMISAGFDGHRDDPLASLNLSTEMYSEMTRMLVDRARKYCRGRIVCCLEGGYHPTALEQSVRCHLEELTSD